MLVTFAKVVPLRRAEPDGPGLDESEFKYSSADDEQLVRRALDDDSRAKEVLCRRHLGSVRALASRLLPGDPELDDVVQETFVAALDNLHKLRDDSSIAWWLRGIAVNVVRHRLRRRKWLRRLGAWTPAQLSADTLAASGAPPDVVAELRSTYAILERMNPDTRVALTLARLEGLSLAEVAEHMNISVSTVSRRLATAEVEFKNHLERRTPA